MVKLVKQIRVVTRVLCPLVETVESRILTERLCSKPYWNIFGYYPLNRTIEYCKSVPACRSILLIETRGLSKGADHARINGFSFRQRTQRKCVLNTVSRGKGLAPGCSFFKERYYTCNAYSNCIK